MKSSRHRERSMHVIEGTRPAGHSVVSNRSKPTLRVRDADGRRLSLLAGGHARARRHSPSQHQPAYEWLSGEDRMFLTFERPNAQMHIGALMLFEGRPLLNSSGGADMRRLRQHVAGHLPAIPRYRQRLLHAPGDGAPVWIDDADFHIGAHVRHVRLKRPADLRALQRVASHILSQPLDRSRPLWEMWVVDGLADGRLAIINKTHHCMVDGIAGADLLTILLSPVASGTVERPPHWLPRPAPSPSMLMRDRLAREASAARAAAAEVWRIARNPSRAGKFTRYAAGIWQALGLGVRPAPDSPLNRPIGPHRRFAWFSVDLRDVKEVKNQLGATVNDVVLATVAGALRRFLLRRDPDSRLCDLRVLIPVNTRSAAESSAMGNHVAAWLMHLPVGEPQPLRRLAQIRSTTAALKGANDVLGAELLTGAGSSLLGWGARLLERLRPFNLVVTNVPGPPLPLYLLGARLQHVYPLVPLFPNQGLGVAVFSYADTLCWGLNADCHVVPDIDALAEAVGDAFRELREAAQYANDSPAPLLFSQRI
jgi:WS/DGAT/MGAT family acyltransferase